MIKELALYALSDPATQWLAIAWGFGLALVVGLGVGTLAAKLWRWKK